jgi:hypothetical protein
MSATSAQLRPRRDERRRHQRLALTLLGRYMLANRLEYPCQTINVSPGGLALLAPVAGGIGERVVVYLDQVGRVEGKIVRHFPNGFAMTISATVRKREKLASQLTWLVNKALLGLPEDRRHERLEPRNPRTLVTLPDGRKIVARLIDVSHSGAAVAVDEMLESGLRIVVGRMPAKIIRAFDGGIAVEFHRMLTEAELDSELCVPL